MLIYRSQPSVLTLIVYAYQMLIIHVKLQYYYANIYTLPAIAMIAPYMLLHYAPNISKLLLRETIDWQMS